jgi:RNA polymerase sigma-70 factor, ECF subfamily
VAKEAATAGERDEGAVRSAWEGGDMGRAVAETLQLYGAEILGLLLGMHRDRDVAMDVFSGFTERLFTSFDRFEWKCSVRTWSYLLARRASADYRRGERAGRVPLSQAAVVSELVARVRTETLPYLRTEAREEIERLRDELPEDDRMLLVLRVDRGLAWDDLARVFLDGQLPAAAELKRESARLRKRFQLVKDRLLQLGRERGLLED